MRPLVLVLSHYMDLAVSIILENEPNIVLTKATKTGFKQKWCCPLQVVHERIQGFVKEVQAGGPSPAQQQRPGQGAAAPGAPGQDSQAAAKFREEELTRQKARH